MALNPSTPAAALEYVLDDLDLVLVMSVNPGFGGQSFIPSAHRKIREVKTLLGSRPVDVSVDGGVKAGLAKSLKLASVALRTCSGSRGVARRRSARSDRSNTCSCFWALTTSQRRANGRSCIHAYPDNNVANVDFTISAMKVKLKMSS